MPSIEEAGVVDAVTVSSGSGVQGGDVSFTVGQASGAVAGNVKIHAGSVAAGR